ncbi:MAG: hypothetical protein ACR2QQ_15565 [Gammaproteobacteria bacterium]
MHVAEAKRRLGTSVSWLADTMDNVFHDTMGLTPNSEIILDSEAMVVVGRPWSNPEALRGDMENLVGRVDRPTSVADLNLPEQPLIGTVAKGIVPRVTKPEGAMPAVLEPLSESTDLPFYAKLRAEGTPELYATGKGTMYLGFHLDPLYRVHWNNEVDPVEFRITVPESMAVTPSEGVAVDPEEPADADPREFLVEVDGAPGDVFDLRVQYFACDDALTFCIPVRQDYRVHLSRDEHHDWSVPTDADGSWQFGRPRAGMSRF